MRARELPWLVALAAVVGCASATHEVHEGAAAAPAPLDAPPLPAAEREAAPAPADDELGLAEYERLLAANEDRLRAAGVLVAQREQIRAPDSRYAPPPPVAAHGDSAAAAGPGVATPLGGASRTRRDAAKEAKPKTTATASSRPSAPKPTAPARQARAEKAEESREPTPEAAADEDLSANRCQQVCDLADATCDLAGKICDLAARHSGDARYTGLCRRADDDCDLAAAACQRCSP